MTPVKPSVSRSSVWTFAERDAGYAPSMHSTMLWLTSTNGEPAAMPDSKGTRSDFSNVVYGRASSAMPVCVSALLP